MTTEKGSDTLFPDWGDLRRSEQAIAEDDAKRAAEEQRLRDLKRPVVVHEPGRRHPDPDVPPPADQDHAEFNPTPEEC